MMDKILLALLFFTSVNIINGNILNYHHYLTEHFRRTTLPSDVASVQTKWITQPVDQFNQSDQRTWKMKYYEKMDNWSQGGPIIISIGGEGPIYNYFLGPSFGSNLASQINGAVFYTEHRYYGESQPFPTLSVSNFKYLSSRQALADIANLIRHIKQSNNLSASKVVVIGGSYAGNLAAWMRLLYPDLVDAALASSAPVLAKLDFIEYMDQVDIDFKKYAKPDCYKAITKQFDNVRNWIKTDSGQKMIKNVYNICKETDLNRRENQGLFILNIMNKYMRAAQHGSTESIPNFPSCGAPTVLPSQINLNESCTLVDFDSYFNPNNPIDMFTTWMYQTCTEFGYYQTAPKNGAFRGMPLDVDWYVKMCTTLFGSQFDKASIEAAIYRTNYMYGGLKPNVSKVFFSHGEIDPWHRLGILDDLSDTAPVRIIPGASHCSDLFPTDNPNIKKVQQEEIMYIKKWIGIPTVE